MTIIKISKDEDLPPHLRKDAKFFRCNECGRKTWARVAAWQKCGMPQPNGTRCNGNFETEKLLGEKSD
jgi:hypothetical protein